MVLKNHEIIGRGLEQLREGLMPFIEMELKEFYGQNWWNNGIEAVIMGKIGPEAQARGPLEERYALLDVQALLIIIWNNWSREIFQPKLGHIGRSYISELRDIRNKWAHQQSFSDDDAHRALDTMHRLLELIRAPEAESLKSSAWEIIRQRFDEEKRREVTDSEPNIEKSLSEEIKLPTDETPNYGPILEIEDQPSQILSLQAENKSRLFPDWNDINNFHNPLTEGERRIIEFLDEVLPDDWMIFAQPYLNGSRPDVVILNPKFGMTIIEVKDWNLKSYCWENGKLCVKKGDRNHEIENPIDKANYYKSIIFGLLVPRLGEAADKNRKVFGFIKTALYLHKMGGKEAKDFFNNERYASIIGYDDLDKNKISSFIRRSDSSILGDLQGGWVKEILFWLTPPFHSKEQSQLLELSAEQKEHAEPKSGHFRLRGVAGSGKTLIIAYRAANLASQGFRVLVVTYNITLWHFVRDMVARTPYEFSWSNINFKHFHGFCNDFLNELGVPKPRENYLETIVQTVESALNSAMQQGKNLDYLKYDAILIDEGQDFKWEWYNLLSKFLAKRDELLFVCDKKQNIYGRDLNWIDGGMRNVKFRGRWRELKTIYRMPKKIGDAANSFSDIFGLDKAIEVERYEQTTLLNKPLKPHFIWKNISGSEWLIQIRIAYNLIRSAQLRAKEGHPSDIVILVPNKNYGATAIKSFEDDGIEANHVFEDDLERRSHRNKKAFWLGDSRLKMCTYHSFKGWESRHVILLIPEKWDFASLDSLVYTAITRTRENIIVLNCNNKYVDFGENYPSDWED